MSDSAHAAAAPPRELSASDAAFVVAADALTFATTAEVAITPDWKGQERALAAIELGLGVAHAGFNIYVSGLGGTQREQTVASLLTELTRTLPRPGDRVLVQNFQNRDRPRAFYLPAGQGKQLRRDMVELVEDLKRSLPETFRKETFENEKEALSERYGHEGEAIARELQQRATEKGFVVQYHPQGGIFFLPLRKDGQPMEPEEFQKLSQPEQDELRQKERELGRDLKTMLRRQQALARRLGREVKDAERRVAADVIAPMVDDIAQRYESAEVHQYLNDVHEHMLDNLEAFREPAPAPPPIPGMYTASAADGLVDYEINVLVDNSATTGAPIIIEGSPTYKNLFGSVERMVDPSGKLVTNFTRIKTGSLLRGHGGCVIINALDALTEPQVWRPLKRCLKSEELEIEAYDPFALFATTALKPEPMRISTRVVLTGPAELFQLLYFYDEEFREIFKVKADFGFEVDGDDARASFVAQVARIVRDEQLPAFRRAAVARLIEFGARSVNHRRKLPSQWEDLADVMREAAFWCRKAGAAEVDDAHVQHALEQRIFRLNRIEEKLRELIRDGVLLVDVDGRKVGQVNGLAVLNLGGYEFGRPSRVTAAVAMGGAGIINIEREAQLSGHTHDKGVLIVSGYLRRLYAQDFPLSLSASLCFEQSYSGIDGDSASSTELYALISSLSGVPLRQDLAVTGSVNQWGEIQPIGGINEKVEGFYATCRAIGLTGAQGVVMPVQNIDGLVLRPEVVDAIRAGQFHLYPIRTIDEGLEVLSGVKAGSVAEEGTIHRLAVQRLRQLAEGLKHFGTPPPPPPSMPASPPASPPAPPK
ncbi:MAG: AAA family ATPase [Deltaproteobacteria bacterium]|nr:AAA family ATPase [Deltaproteobacteria bacterium]MBI3389321.1 AAA family ATPase [Deltaproteobacteria bacterium]